jgi:hypothetical protein
MTFGGLACSSQPFLPHSVTSQSPFSQSIMYNNMLPAIFNGSSVWEVFTWLNSYGFEAFHKRFKVSCMQNIIHKAFNSIVKKRGNKGNKTLLEESLFFYPFR